MAGSTLKVAVGATTYFVDDPKGGDGLKATASAVADGGEGDVARILHRDRLNLDRARDRGVFAAAADTDPADLLQVRDRVLDFLAPTPAAAGDGVPDDGEVAVAAARELLAAPELLDRAEAVVRALGYAGGRWLPLLIFLAFASRLLPRPINLVITGPSAAGKSFAVMLVARLFPPEATYALNGMSERLLAYTDADLRHRTLIVQEAAALERDGVGAALLRSVAWEGSVAYETVEKTAQGLKARRIEKPGPTGFVTTTTGRVEPELETRVLTAGVPDDEATTRTILQATAQRANGHAREEPDLRPWHAAQRLLAGEGEREVTVPFAEKLAAAYRADQVRARRDFVQLLALVQAHALVFREQRGRDGRGRVVADERDYRAVFELAAPVFGAIAGEGATPSIREAVEAVAALVPDAAAPPATVTQVAGKLEVHKSVASRRVGLALKGGWLANEEDCKGRPLRLRPGDPLPADAAALPDPGDLFADPPRNRPTAQPPDQEPHHDGETGGPDGCAGGCAVADEGEPEAAVVAAVAERLQGGAHPYNPQNHTEIAPSHSRGCAVAPPPQPCVQCGTPVPAGWGFYCGRHGGAPQPTVEPKADVPPGAGPGGGTGDVWAETYL